MKALVTINSMILAFLLKIINHSADQFYREGSNESKKNPFCKCNPSFGTFVEVT